MVLLEPSKVEKLVSTELAHNLAIIQTSPTGLVSNKVLLCCKGLVTWMVAEKGFAVFVNSFKVHWYLVLVTNILTTLGTIHLCITSGRMNDDD